MAHIAKYKATSVGHMLAHYRRDASSMERDNIDPKRVKNDMVVGHYTNKDGRLVVGRVVPRGGEPNWGTVERRIERVNEAQRAAGKRATRKDAVVMADVVVTLPDNVRKGDEDRFYGRVGALYGLSRGEKRLEGQPARRHKSVAEYKAESRRVQAELDEKAEQLEMARVELASTRAQLAECRSQVEGFAARFERIKAELAQIAECLSVRGFLGSFKAKLAEFAENPICKAALAAGRDFMTARDGRRAEKVLVDGAREKVVEMEGLSREMGEWSPWDEVDELRGASRELERSGSARGFGTRGGDAI